MTRAEEVEANLARVRERIATAEEAAGRPAGGVALVVVTKFFPASDVRVLAGLGIGEVAENRHQEAEAKAAECVDLDLRWHFIGGLQSNKAAAVASYSSVVESLDRAKLVGPLARGADGSREPLEVLLQVSLDPPTAEGRSGAEPSQLDHLASEVEAAGGLRLCGLMAVAPLGEDPADAFGRLADIRAEFVSRHPAATRLSAGMSGDLEQAIHAGATHVRVGSAVLGSRPRVQ